MPDSIRRLIWALAAVAMTGACQAPSRGPAKLADVDVAAATGAVEQVSIQPKTEQEVRKAYTDYLESVDASGDDKLRINALTRLAELEFRYSNQLLQQKQESVDSQAEALAEQRYQQRLDRTIELLATSLRDYPDAKNNDRLLYQIAKAYDQNGQHQESIDALITLVEKYPASPFFVEAQFRIAEDAFSNQDYSAAEYAYSEVIVAPGNAIFFEKSVFKRGWARFKQQYYTDAVDDFLQSVVQHEFDEFEKLSDPEREQFEEYFRAIGLSFSYLGGVESLNEYFSHRPDFRYTYHTYSMVSDIYRKQERFSDAVDTHQQFIRHFPESENIPYSHLKIIEIWKNSGFEQKIYQAIEKFYVAYQPASTYWQNQNENSRVNRAIRRALKEYVILMTGHFHSRYQKKANNADYAGALRWYERYLQHYTAYAQNDNIYFLYAELLMQKNQLAQAFDYYELAAYDNDLIVNKDAAYATITVSNRLLQDPSREAEYLERHIAYALRYAQQYGSDKRSQPLILHAAELSFRAGRFKSTIELADLKLANDSTDSYVASLKAGSYFALGELAEAESIYRQILQSKQLNGKQRGEYSDKLALTIYKLGENAQQNNDIPQAVQHFARIAAVAPESGIAETGLYDAIALSMQHNQWDSAIGDIKRFQTLYPRSDYRVDVSKKLSAAYLASDQGIKAAQEFEKISSLDEDAESQAAALWTAATLYEEKNKPDDAIRSYQEYAKRHKNPYPQYLEAMNRLSELYAEKGLARDEKKWREAIVEADGKALNNVKTDRSKFIASYSYLELARTEKTRFESVKLTLPLKTSLQRKKNSMQSSVKLFGNASLNQDYDIVTESTFSIAQIYRIFSEALLNSDRPQNLTDEQLDQYEILLEDQAFPFEDKAIEFFEINLSRTNEGFYNDWIDGSLVELKSLYPVRYKRQPLRDNYVAEMD